ncbi:hypothetical protein NXW71_04380 [Parabacteroides merdae]|nr:hypothetical protein [Parabacteroides merdae]
MPARIALFRGDEIVRVESLPVGQEGDKAITPDDIVSISVLKDGGDGLAFIKYKDGRSAIYPLGNSCFGMRARIFISVSLIMIRSIGCRQRKSCNLCACWI